MPDIVITLRLTGASDQVAHQIRRGVAENPYTNERGALQTLADALTDLLLVALDQDQAGRLDATISAKVVRDA